MLRFGWMMHEADKWTRKGKNEKEKNTNIDIVASMGFEKDDIKIEGMNHDIKVSDHKPIQIKIKDYQNKEPLTLEKDKILNK